MCNLCPVPFVLSKHRFAATAMQRANLVNAAPGTKENCGLWVGRVTCDETDEFMKETKHTKQSNTLSKFATMKFSNILYILKDTE